MSQAASGREELAYALVTPYSLRKSRTGGIIARLLWADVRLAAARMFAPAPDGEFIRKYCDALYDPDERYVPLRYQKLLIQYVLENFGRVNARRTSNRMMLLVFRGPNAQRSILEAVGHISQAVRGDDLRGTFGDFVVEDATDQHLAAVRRAAEEAMSRYPALQKIETPSRRVHIFEPAVLTGVSPEMTEKHLRLFCQHAYTDGGFVLNAIEELAGKKVETSMVILKPESFRSPRNPLPGNLIDFFARTGMYITGAEMLHLSVEQAREFYALKLPQFRETLKGMVARKARDIVEKARHLGRLAADKYAVPPDQAVAPGCVIPAVRELEALFTKGFEARPGEVKQPVLDAIFRILAERLKDLNPPDSFYDALAEELKELNAQAEFDELIRYMSGCDPRTGKPVEKDGEAMCMALLYSGENGLKVIRRRLKELREVYGRDVLQNRAHASDPDEDPMREMEVLGMPCSPRGEPRPCGLERVVREIYGSC
jgi:nucleoside diphosphate kinase